jgi:hypothetical protein
MLPRPFFFAALACVALSSCDSPTAPRALPTSIAMSPGSGPPPALSASVAGNTVVVTGTIGVNVPCYEFTADASPQQDALVVTLHATPVGELCTQNTATIGYTITIRDVPTGTWNLRLIYDYRGPSPSTIVAFDTRVTVD